MNKKEIIKQYKETIQPMGIYQIKNMKNGKIYIESAKNLRGRINRDKFQLKNNLHLNKEMQIDFNDIGGECFSFEILDHLKPKEDINHDSTEELETLKNLWLEKLQPYKEKGYNTYKKLPENH